MRVSGLMLALYMCAGTANAVDDMPTMTVAYYLHAFGTKTPNEQSQVVNYLAGIRDHMFWQCEYRVTVKDLIAAANQMIEASQSTYDHAEFVKWATRTPFGDMVFAGLKANPPHGEMRCS